MRYDNLGVLLTSNNNKTGSLGTEIWFLLRFF